MVPKNLRKFGKPRAGATAARRWDVVSAGDTARVEKPQLAQGGVSLVSIPQAGEAKRACGQRHPTKFITLSLGKGRSSRLSVWTSDRLERRNVDGFGPWLQRGPADLTGCVAGVRHQELFFRALVLSATIAF